MTDELARPDRYNELGEWKPLISKVDTEGLQHEISSLTSDEQVQGALLYMRVTGKKVIEFVVRTSLEFPANYITIGNFNLWTCPRVADSTYANQNVRVYDGWKVLNTDDPNLVREAIDKIARTLNRIAFAFQASLSWRLKYLPTSHKRGYETPDIKDISILQIVLTGPPNPEEDRILDAAIDWYNRGRSSGNIFTEFLCYYIALESVAIAVTEGDADFDLGYTSRSRSQLCQERVACIEALHERLFSTEPAEFVSKAYFDCVIGLSKRVRQVVELVFDPAHPYVDALFNNKSRPSLADIRSKLAHGRIALVSPADERLIYGRIHEIAEISHQFLLRIIHRRAPDSAGTNVPTWSQLHAIPISPMTDPRDMLIASAEWLIRGRDWRIRPEWCD